MSDSITSLRKHEIEPLGVNFGDEESHRAFKAEYSFPFELLVDEGNAVAKAYGAVKDDGESISRSVVVVGKDGKVVFSESGAPAMPRVINAVRKATAGAREDASNVVEKAPVDVGDAGTSPVS